MGKIKKVNSLALDLQMFASPSYPETDLQTVETLNGLVPKEIVFVSSFAEQLQGLAKILGISRLMPVQEGMKVKLYGGLEAELKDGNVAEGDLIPLSKVTPKEAEEKEIKLKKWRKATSAESIQTYGFSEAIDRTDTALVREIQKAIRDELFTTFTTSAKSATIAGKGLQGAVAGAWGALNTLFEDDVLTTVVFANPMDVAEYIGTQPISMQTTFGVTYLNAFTNTVVISTSQIKKGTVYATVADNLVLAYVSANGAAGQAFQLTSDDTGFIGMKHFLHHETATHQTLFMSGILIFPERLDGIVSVDLTDTPDLDSEA